MLEYSISSLLDELRLIVPDQHEYSEGRGRERESFKSPQPRPPKTLSLQGPPFRVEMRMTWGKREGRRSILLCSVPLIIIIIIIVIVVGVGEGVKGGKF